MTFSIDKRFLQITLAIIVAAVVAVAVSFAPLCIYRYSSGEATCTRIAAELKSYHDAADTIAPYIEYDALSDRCMIDASAGMVPVTPFDYLAYAPA